MDTFYQIYVCGEFRETNQLLPVMNPYNDILTDLPSRQPHKIFMQIATLMHDAKDKFTQNFIEEVHKLSHGNPLEEQMILNIQLYY
jgi:hypothetical protein